MNKRSYHVDPYYRGKRTLTHFCNEPQALVNVCLTCPLPSCQPDSCGRYKIAEVRLKYKIFPLVDVEFPKVVRRLHRCTGCEFGNDCGGKVFCPLIRGTCVREETKYE